MIFGSYDGTTTMIDLRDLETAVEINRQRREFTRLSMESCTTEISINNLGPALAVAWIPQAAAAVYTDVDSVVQMHKVFGGGKHRFNAISLHRGVVWVSLRQHGKYGVLMSVNRGVRLSYDDGERQCGRLDHHSLIFPRLSSKTSSGKLECFLRV